MRVMRKARADTPRARRLHRHRRVRAKVSGTPQRPRLAVFRSLAHIYAQVIDDERGHTLVSASTLEPGLRETREGTKTEQSRLVGRTIGQRAREKGIEAVVFDRGGFLYHGRVAAVAEAAREAGLKF
jgi:large subunit ribosomal protein L18